MELTPDGYACGPAIIERYHWGVRIAGCHDPTFQVAHGIDAADAQQN
ncbi:hypothetical protein [Paracoccus contaminans]|nr:hypothetical protein [Paracoccus contaminans]